MGRNLLFLDHAKALGGAEHSLLLLLKHLDRAEWQPHLACPRGALADAASALSVHVHHLSLPRLRRSALFLRDWLATAQAIARLASQVNAVLIHTNTVRSAIYGALAARLARIPFLWHMRDFWLSESRPSRPWLDELGKRLLCSQARHVIANSHAVASTLPWRHKLTVVHNGIEVGRFNPATDGLAFRHQYSIPDSAPLVGTIGRLRPWKGQQRFVRAMAQVRSAVPEAWFVVVGGSVFEDASGYRQQLQILASELLADQVAFTGQVEDTQPALAAIDVFVHAGDPEPFGLVNIEAMAMRKPVVAFGHGALPEIVVEGETGLLVPPTDEAALASAVLTLLRDGSRRQAMGAAGRARIEAYFTAEQMVAGVEAVLREVAC